MTKDNGDPYGGLQNSGFWVKKYYADFSKDEEAPWTPENIADRVQDGELRLGWPRDPRDEVFVGDPVAVWISGKEIRNGFYAFGRVSRTESDAVYIEDVKLPESAGTPVFEYDPASARVNAVKRRTVFVAPRSEASCSLDHGAESCKKGGCFECSFHAEQPLIDLTQLPEDLVTGVDRYLPAFWVYANRSKAVTNKANNGQLDVQQVAGRWRAFKDGDMDLAPFFASAMIKVMEGAGLAIRDADMHTVIVPIPLDPDKKEDDRPHRTKVLADWIRRLSATSARVHEALILDRSFSKTRLQKEGKSRNEIGEARGEATHLKDDGQDRTVKRVIVVDDVATRGDTLAYAARLLHDRFPNAKVIAVTAGQMTVSEAGAGDGPLPIRTLGRADSPRRKDQHEYVKSDSVLLWQLYATDLTERNRGLSASMEQYKERLEGEVRDRGLKRKSVPK